MEQQRKEERERKALASEKLRTQIQQKIDAEKKAEEKRKAREAERKRILNQDWSKFMDLNRSSKKPKFYKSRYAKRDKEFSFETLEAKEILKLTYTDSHGYYKNERIEEGQSEYWLFHSELEMFYVLVNKNRYAVIPKADVNLKKNEYRRWMHSDYKHFIPGKGIMKVSYAKPKDIKPPGLRNAFFPNKGVFHMLKELGR